MLFLTSYERNLIHRDFSDFLKSYETTDIQIMYRVPVGAVTENEVYSVKTAASWEEQKIKTRASQEIIRALNEDILRWGIIAAGDCIFYIDKSIDLSFIDYDSCYIKTGPTGNEIQWTPVPKERKEFWNYLGFRLGNSQVAQVIPCKIKL